MELNNKTLLVFDFDNTLIEDSTFHPLFFKYYTKDQITELRQTWNKISLIELFREGMQQFKKLNKTIEDMKDIVENIKLIDGYENVFKTIRDNKDKFMCIIISGGNKLMINWLTDKYNITDLIYKVLAINSYHDEELIIKFDDPVGHGCDGVGCHVNQCKRVDLEKLLNEYKSANTNFNQFHKIIYVGDGENDYCPAKLLGESDVLFARKAFNLNELLEDHGHKENLVCKINYWENGHDINNYLVDLLNIK